ncbi:hypothetical protein [Paraburkholderia phytofirmans]|uniref:hypothetical protein n=1 Tax=Paraburkholderia phytofirmans TaxID=261302 RepID=UPI001F1D5D10|nr:hypothetical protein [Paraburkholderia phytofirmans]
MIDLDTVFRNHLFEITQTQRIRHVPPNAQQDHVHREMQPLQNFRDARRQRFPANAFFLHRRFGHIFHAPILPYRLIATEPWHLPKIV